MRAALTVLLVLLAVACRDARRAAPAHDAAPAAAPAAAKDDVDPGEARAAAVAAAQLGHPGPALTVKTLDGASIDLATLYGTKPVYLKFWATWCIPCRKQMPAFEHIYETLGDQIQVIAVNVGVDDDEATVRAFREKYGLKMPIVVDDGRLAAALDLQVTPQHVLIGRDARIAYVGHLDGPRLDAALQAVLAAPAPTTPPAGQAAAPIAVFRAGDLVHSLVARRMDGTTVTLSGAGRPRAVVLFASWCEDYLAETVPESSRACAAVRKQVAELASSDVEWLGVVHGLWTSVESVGEYQKETGTQLRLALDSDGSLFRAFDVHQLPTVVLIDRDGRVARVVGPKDHDLADAVHAVVAAR